MSIKLKYALYGAAFGMCFPVFAVLLQIVSNNLEWNIASIPLAHKQNILIYMIDTAPLFLGLFALLGGISKAKADNLVVQFKNLAEELKLSNEYLSMYSNSIFQSLFGSSDKIEAISHLITSRSDELTSYNKLCFNEAGYLTESTNSLQESTRNLIEVNKSLRDFNLEIIHKIEEFTQLNKRIVENFQGIEEIGIEIRILSINASIESHKSGNAGKSFNVIAKQIKSLADSIESLNKNTKAISAKVHSELESLKNTSAHYKQELQNTDALIGDLEQKTSRNESSLASINNHIDNSLHLQIQQKEQFESISENLQAINKDKSEIISKLKNAIETNNKLIEKIGNI